ncbi:MAG: aromatic amino acid lyase [Actinomycetota bacterium]|nr:aromatic amino acid lyase [Actinomycetota bacterium]
MTVNGRGDEGPNGASFTSDDEISSLDYVLGLLTDEDVDWLAANGRRLELAPGEQAVREGAVHPPVLLVLEGKLDADGSVHTVACGRRCCGDLVGIVSFLDGGTSPVTVTASSHAVVYEIPHAELSARLELDVGFAARFYRALAVIVAGRRAQGDAAGALDPPLAEQINTYLADARMRRLLQRVSQRDEVLITGSDLTVEQVARVAWHRSAVGVAPSARARMEASRKVVNRLVAGETPVYGLNTNVGALKDARIADSDQPLFQRHILLSHSAGVEPNHSTDVVRAILLARLNGMARGGAGVQPAVFDALLAMLDAGLHPLVPRRGSIGMSDLVPLAHMSLPLIGEGEAELDGQLLSGADAMAAAGIDLPTLGAKDGLALVSANSASVGHGALAIIRCVDLLALADVAAALSLEGLGGHATVLDHQIDDARPFSGQLTSAHQMRLLLEGSSLWTAPPTLGVQDPISFRSAVQVHGAVLDVLASVRGTLETELNSTGDNPMVLIDREAIISDGNFHPAGLSIAFDTLKIALAQLTSMAANRVVRLMDPHFTHLAAYLSPRPGLNVGLGVLQKTATALNAEVRLAADPTSLDYIPVAGAIEDHATMAVEGVAQAAQAIDSAFGVFAVELLVAAQAIDLREGITLGAGTGAAYRTVRACCPFTEDDRLLAREIANVRALLEDGSLLDAVSTATGQKFGARVRPQSAPAQVQA